MSFELIKYEKACQALTEARTVDEVKAIADKAIAIKEYARQAKNKQLEIDAAEIRIRAERRLGEMLKEMEKNKGAKGIKPITGSKREPVKDTTPTLAEIGIDKKLSSRSQKLAAIPEKKFENIMGEWRDNVKKETEKVTTKLIIEGEKEENIKNIQEGINNNNKKEKETNQSYDIIVIDPPWPYETDYDSEDRRVASPYPEMSIEKITELKLNDITKEELFKNSDCILWLWTTHKFIWENHILYLNIQMLL